MSNNLLNERQMATSLRDIEISHITRYMFAVPFVKEGDFVLDACCGTGYGVRILTDFTKASFVYGFDASREAIELGRRHFNSELFLNSFEDFETTGPYDVITCFEAIEHILEPEKLIEKLASWLAPGGKLIISTPNEAMMPWSKSRFPEHIQHFTFNQLRDMLRAVGFTTFRMFNQQKFISCINNGIMGKFIILVCERDNEGIPKNI